MPNAPVTAISIILIFIVWFYMDTKEKRWSDERIGNLASSVLMYDTEVNIRIPRDDGMIQPTYKMILPQITNINHDKTLANIQFMFIDQENNKTYQWYTFTLKDHDISYCSFTDSRCVEV